MASVAARRRKLRKLLKCVANAREVFVVCVDEPAVLVGLQNVKE
jgi:hypothetical protein